MADSGCCYVTLTAFCKLQGVSELQALTVLKARVPLVGRRGPHFPGEHHAPYLAALSSHGHSRTPQSSSRRRGWEMPGLPGSLDTPPCG